MTFIAAHSKELFDRGPATIMDIARNVEARLFLIIDSLPFCVLLCFISVFQSISWRGGLCNHGRYTMDSTERIRALHSHLGFLP